MPQKVHLRRALKGSRFYGAEWTYEKVQKDVEKKSTKTSSCSSSPMSVEAMDATVRAEKVTRALCRQL